VISQWIVSTETADVISSFRMPVAAAQASVSTLASQLALLAWEGIESKSLWQPDL
jgi:hypothetical protein